MRRTDLRRLLGKAAPAVGQLLTGPRHAWVQAGYAHIEVPDFGSLEDAARLEKALEAVNGVRWAAWNGVLGRVIVRFDEQLVKLETLLTVVNEGETGGVPLAGSRDIDPTAGNAVNL